MANCHDLFERFYKNIALSDTKKKNLKQARKALRDRIKYHFKEVRKEKIPFFAGQGSFYMNTIVNPIDGEYDIDDGVYLQNLDSDNTKWPTAEIVHSWILEAVKGHTTIPPKDKSTCIRVLYPREEEQDYHVDLPIYGISNNIAYLAEKGKINWPESDPKAFIDWFKDQIESKGEQLRRIICYLKAWSEYNQKQAPMLNGISITIITAEQLVISDNDDDSLIQTVQLISQHLKKTEQIIKPVVPNENLLDGWKKENIIQLCKRLDILSSRGEEAQKTEDKEKASLLWIGQFGKRFPKYNPPDENDKSSTPKISPAWKAKGPAILGGNPKG